jgi:hypothetical protein
MAASPNFTAPSPSSSSLLNLDQVEDLLKLQKAAQKISSILDLDQLVDKVVNEVATPSDVWILISTCTTRSAANCRWHAPMAAPAATFTAPDTV